MEGLGFHWKGDAGGVHLARKQPQDPKGGEYQGGRWQTAGKGSTVLLGSWG